MHVFNHPRFAPVGPVALMSDMLNWGITVVGDYHLLLAHDVLSNRSLWHKWASNLRYEFGRVSQPDPLLIMDSSVIELGMPLSTKDILKAADIVGAQVIVLPDIIGDEQASYKFLDEYNLLIGEYDLEKQPKGVMFVPQGTTMAGYVRSLEYASGYDCIDWIGLPRDALKYDVKSRRDLIDITTVLMPTASIHLLGMSDNVADDVLSCRHHPNVAGIDSAVPVRAGLRSIPLKMGRDNYGKREDYWQQIHLNALSIENIQTMRKWLAL